LGAVVVVAEAPEVVVAFAVVGLTVVVVAEAPEVVVAFAVVGLTVVTVDEAGPSRVMTAEPMAATPKMAPRPTTAVLSLFTGRLPPCCWDVQCRSYTRKVPKFMGKVQGRGN